METPQKPTPRAKPEPVVLDHPIVSMTLAERVFHVQQDVQTVVKSGFNEHFKYTFAQERDVIAEVKPLLGKYRLLLVHSVIHEEKTENLTKLNVEFTLINIDNPTETLPGHAIGYGQDTQDKGAPKAYTMALKYYLSKQFLIETGDDAENAGKARGGAKMGEKDPIAEFDTARRMIAASRNIDGLMEWAEKLKVNKVFNKAQKIGLTQLIRTRVEELDGTKSS